MLVIMALRAPNWLFSLLLFTTPIYAKDLLFLSTMTGKELSLSSALGFTSDIVTEAQWRAMKQSDFMAYKAIIIGDPYCSKGIANFNILNATKSVWSPAITGNVILIGMCTLTQKIFR
jgi:hypothetical protein